MLINFSKTFILDVGANRLKARDVKDNHCNKYLNRLTNTIKSVFPQSTTQTCRIRFVTRRCIIIQQFVFPHYNKWSQQNLYKHTQITQAYHKQVFSVIQSAHNTFLISINILFRYVSTTFANTFYSCFKVPPAQTESRLHHKILCPEIYSNP